MPRILAAPALLGIALAGATLVPAFAESSSVPDLTLAAASPRAQVQPGQTIRPVPEVLPVARYELTGRFGESSGLWSSVHTGLDFAASYGAPVRAITGGTVVSTDYDGAYGLKTVIVTDEGTELWFCHQDSVTVAPGRTVTAGEVIGAVGTSGNVTGPHLHLEVRPGGGDPVDPERALAAWGLRA